MNRIIRVCYLFPLLLLPFLQSCSSSYVYDNLGWMVHWYVDDYVELTGEQKKAFDQHFSQLQEWHRKNELPDYQQWLEQVYAQLQQPDVSGEVIRGYVSEHRQKTLQFWARLVKEAEPHLLVLLDKLSERQQQALERNFRKQLLQRYEKKRAMSRRQWEKDKIAKMKKGLKPWVGSLTRAQEKRLQEWAQSLHNLDELNREFRLDWQSRLIKLQELTLPQRQGKLAELVSYPDRFRSRKHLALLDENRQLTGKAIAEILTLRNARQNKQALAEIKQWLQRISSARS